MDYDHKHLGYKLFKPDKKIFLRYDLEEISGIAYYNTDTLAAIEDENGILYLLDAQSGEIFRKVNFADPGDYEGVEVVGNTIFVLRSDGDIFSFDIGESDKVEAIQVETDLSAENDAEGLVANNGNLLIALKGSGDIDENKVKGKAVYVYDTASRRLLPNELLSVDENDLNAFIAKRKFFNKVNDFDPSGIAKHPITGDYYLLSADKILAVFDPELNIKEVISLHPVIYNQAEGICFSPDGTMFISSEGGGGKGKLMKINYAK